MRRGSSSVERIELGLQPVDRRLHFGAGGEQFVDRLLTAHVDVGGRVGIRQRGRVCGVGIAHGDRDHVGFTDRTRVGTAVVRSAEPEVVLHPMRTACPSITWISVWMVRC